MKIRPATEADLLDLTAIAHEAKGHWGYPEAWMRAWSPALTFDARSLVEMSVVVAESDGVVYGMCALIPGDGRWQLEHLWIRPAAMGRGVGRALFDDGAAYARSQGASALVIASDPQAEGFYERMGAVRVGAEPAPMEGDPDRALPVLEYALDRATRMPD